MILKTRSEGYEFTMGYVFTAVTSPRLSKKILLLQAQSLPLASYQNTGGRLAGKVPWRRVKSLGQWGEDQVRSPEHRPGSSTRLAGSLSRFYTELSCPVFVRGRCCWEWPGRGGELPSTREPHGLAHLSVVVPQWPWRCPGGICWFCTWLRRAWEFLLNS